MTTDGGFLERQRREIEPSGVKEVRPERLKLDICIFLSMARPGEPWVNCKKGDCHFWQKRRFETPPECLWLIQAASIEFLSVLISHHPDFALLKERDKPSGS